MHSSDTTLTRNSYYVKRKEEKKIHLWAHEKVKIYKKTCHLL